MSLRSLTIGAALLAWAVPAIAQERGTVELGMFGNIGRFDQQTTLNSGVGGGGRVGIYLDERLSLEFEKSEMKASRTLGLADVNVGILAGHVVWTPMVAGPFSIMLGGGAGAGTETNFLHSYGVNALIGAKLTLSPTVVIRADLVSDWLANNSWQSYQRLQFGLSFYRHPNRVTQLVEGPVTYRSSADSVSAEEQARRRQLALDYAALRDSLDRERRKGMLGPDSASSARALVIMSERIHFTRNSAELSDSAKRILDAKVPIFAANPAMRIIITGNTSEPGSGDFNLLLGRRRAVATREYLMSKGVAGVRLEMMTRGEEVLLDAREGDSANATNRRASFRILISDPYLADPKKP